MATTYQPKNITELDQITPDGTESVLAAQGYAARRVTIQSIVNLVGFTQEVKDKISKIPELPIQRSELDAVKSQMIQKVDASALAPYATTAYVDQKVGSIVVPAPDLSSYATKLELQTLSTEVASKATQQNIQTLQQALNQKANTADLTTLATKQELTQATTRIKALEDRPSGSGESFSGNMGGKTIENVGQPTKPADATNKQYVDSAVAAAGENAYQRAKTYVDTRPSGSGGLSEAAVDQKISQAIAPLAKTTDVTTALSGKANNSDIQSLRTELAQKADTSAIPNVSSFITADALAPYAKTVDIPSVAGLETTKAVDAKLSQYVKKAELPAQPDLASYETTAEVDRKLALKADLSAIPSLANYATKDQIPDTSTLATKEELKTYALKSELPTVPDLSSYATNQSVDDKLSQYPKRSEIIPAPDLSAYATLTVTDGLQSQINKKVEQSYADTTYAANLTVNTKVAQCLADAKAYTDQKVAAIGAGGGGSGGNAAELEAKMKLYVQSRVGGLVTNGTGLLKNNENFSQFTFDPSEAYSGFGSFKITGSNQVTTMDEVIPVDPNGTYEFSFATKVEDGTKTTKMYALVDCLDIDGSQILPMHVKTYAVTLAEDLEAASTTIKIIPDDVAKLKAAAGWRWGSGELMYIANGKYTSQSGYHYPEGTYSRNILNGAGVANNKTTLSDDGTWVIGSSLVVTETIKAGKKLIVSFDGGVYSYWMTNVRDAVLTDDWQVFTLKEQMSKVLRPATATIKIGWWANRGQANTTYISNVSFRQV